VPLPGWEPGVGWEEDPVPFDDMPHLLNPACGFIATANTKPQPDEVGPYLGADFVDGYRLLAINRQLAAHTEWDMRKTLGLQMDQQDLSWEELRDVILAAPARDAARRGADLLRNWNGRMSVDSPAATVFQLLMVEMLQRVVRSKAPKSGAYALGKGLSPVTPYNFFCFRRTGHLSRLLRTQPARWFNRPWRLEVAEALGVVVRDLQATHGDDPSRWTWGRLRTLEMHHILGRGRFRRRVFNLGPVPCGGNTETINQASVLPLAPLEPTNNIASLRVVVDVGAWDHSRFVLPGGQSGNPLSPHYDDQFPLWQRGEGIPIAWSDEAVRQATRQTLELRPAKD
jgi:penicillin amidase